MNSSDILRATVENWDKLNREGRLINEYWINDFIDRHESVLLTYGLFVSGIRVRESQNNSLHHTVQGVLGILSMNIELFRRKINSLQ